MECSLMTTDIYYIRVQKLFCFDILAPVMLKSSVMDAHLIAIA